jgi:hypothetical protein
MKSKAKASAKRQNEAPRRDGDAGVGRPRTSAGFVARPEARDSFADSLNRKFQEALVHLVREGKVGSQRTSSEESGQNESAADVGINPRVLALASSLHVSVWHAPGRTTVLKIAA